jgi:hypothetical protein
MKRLVHLASLGALIKGSTTCDDATLNKLNTVMALGGSDQALKLPMLLHRAIWDGRVQHLDLAPEAPFMASPEDMAELTSHCVQATPKWLRYGEEGVIQHDVKKLLSVFRSQEEAQPSA